MSGDVQPRKRKDKRKKKDELSVEEPQHRGTAAVLGEGDVFMHSQHDHGTGGHWCAKIIFFSLLAVLVTLIGLIILENRGLTDLEASSVESRYSGVLEGWLEDVPDDDHHDEHTLELKHHDDDNDEHQEDLSQETGQSDENVSNEENGDHDVESEEEEDEHDNELDEDEDHDDEPDEDNENESDEVDSENAEDHSDEENDDDDDHSAQEREIDDDTKEQNLDSSEDQVQVKHSLDENYDSYEQDDDNDNENENNDQENFNADLESTEDSVEQNDESEETVINRVRRDVRNDDDDNVSDDQQQSIENDDNQELGTTSNEEEDDHQSNDEDAEIEVENIEKEISDDELRHEVVSKELPTSDEAVEEKSEEQDQEQEDENVDDDDDDDDFLEAEELDDAPVVEHITAPAGKPLRELEDDTSSEKPINSLDDEEEYEKLQEKQRKEQEESSNMWLKVVVGGALLFATQAVIRRATAPRDSDVSDDRVTREDSPSAIDRRMTLIPEEPTQEITEKILEDSQVVEEREIDEDYYSSFVKTEPVAREAIVVEQVVHNVEAIPTDIETLDKDVDKELYSDEDEPEMEEEEELEEDIEISNTNSPIEAPKPIEPVTEPEEDVPDDVEIIYDEQLEEEEEIVEEEEEDDEISDVDDTDLLSRLDAKYGRLSEPSRQKDGGNSLEDEWPGEPTDEYWRQQLDQAEQELRQDWLE